MCHKNKKWMSQEIVQSDSSNRKIASMWRKRVPKTSNLSKKAQTQQCSILKLYKIKCKKGNTFNIVAINHHQNQNQPKKTQINKQQQQQQETKPNQQKKKNHKKTHKNQTKTHKKTNPKPSLTENVECLWHQ